MTQTIFPVARRGTLVRAIRRSDKAQCALTLEQGETAIAQIHVKRCEFLTAIRLAVRKAAEEHGYSYEDRDLPGLSPASRSRSLGAIYDFREFAFELDGALMIGRGCVTLCVLTDADADKQRQRGPLPLSKFWMRFIMVTHPSSRADGHLAIDLDIATLAEFDDRCRVLNDGAIRAIAPLYADVVQQVTSQEIDLKLDNNGAFAVLAVGTRDGDFSDLFEAARAGERLENELRRGDADSALTLTRLALMTLKGDLAGNSLSNLTEMDLASSLGNDVGLVLFESPDAQRGLFVAHFGKSLAHFVGLTRMPLNAEPNPDPGRENLARAHSFSANQVSGGLILQYASSF